MHYSEIIIKNIIIADKLTDNDEGYHGEDEEKSHQEELPAAALRLPCDGEHHAARLTLKTIHNIIIHCSPFIFRPFPPPKRAFGASTF